MARKCDVLSKEILEHLEGIEVDDSQSSTIHQQDQVGTGRWKRGTREVRYRINKAFRLAWKRDRIEDLNKLLVGFRDQIQFQMVLQLKMSTQNDFRKREDLLRALDQSKRVILTEVYGKAESILNRLEAGRIITEHAFPDLAQSIAKNQEESEKRIIAAIRAFGKLSHEPTIHEQIQRRILAALYFKQISLRLDTVTHAHQKTFEWIFYRNIAPTGVDTGFARWLETGHGCYWVSGKPGSGKSTLMRFIHQRAKNLDMLRTWAITDQVLMPAFFLWSEGSGIQRLEAGLLRALLFQVLSARPDLMATLLPISYQAALQNSPETYVTSLSDLRKAFEILAELTKASSQFRMKPLKICLVIDGIDELEGDPAPLARFLRKITAHEGIKAIVSGRPINSCELVFEDCPSLRLQDLTAPDIKLYVEDKLEKHIMQQYRLAPEVKAIESITNQIVSRAAGVFLWVILVVSSLATGLENCDGVADLQRRLNKLPPDLRRLYQHIFAHLDPFYRCQAAQYFVLARRFFETCEFPLSTIFFSYAVEERSLTPLSPSQLTFSPQLELTMCKRMEHKIRSRSCNLLEIHYWNGPQTRDFRLTFSTVQFLHKSLTEYLYETSTWRRIQLESYTAEFDVNARLFQAHVIYLKHSEWKHRAISNVAEGMVWSDENNVASLKASLNLVWSIEQEGRTPDPALVELMIGVHCGVLAQKSVLYKQTFLRAATRFWSSGGLHHLDFAVEAGLVTYLEAVLNKSIAICGEQSPYIPALQGLFVSGFQPAWTIPTHCLFRAAKLLLVKGADPNDHEHFSGQSAWNMLLQQFLVLQGKEMPEALDDLVVLFIEYGASLDVSATVSETLDNDVIRPWDLLPQRIRQRLSLGIQKKMEYIDRGWINVSASDPELRTTRNGVVWLGVITSENLAWCRRNWPLSTRPQIMDNFWNSWGARKVHEDRIRAADYLPRIEQELLETFSTTFGSVENAGPLSTEALFNSDKDRSATVVE